MAFSNQKSSYRVFEDRLLAPAKFRVGDIVRFIGTDTRLRVKRYRKEPSEYQVHRDHDEASLEWVLEIYLELAEPANQPGLPAATIS